MKLLFHDMGDCQSFYRVRQPAKFITEPLKKLGIELIVRQDCNVDDYDGFIFQRLPAPQFMPALEEIKRKGKWLGFSIDDDLWHIPTHNPASKVYDEEAMKRIDWLHRNSDWIIVSTPHLASVVIRENVVVCPNLIDTSLWSESIKREGIRIVYPCSAFHSADLDMIASVIEEVIDKLDAQFIFFGDAPESFMEWVRIPGQMFASAVPHMRFRGKVSFVRPVPIEYYPQTLTLLSPTFGLAPLTTDLFNSSKSNLKALEIGMAGGTPLCQDNPAYLNSPCLLVQDWRDTLLNLPESRRDWRQEVTDNYSWQNCADKWVDKFKEILC